MTSDGGAAERLTAVTPGNGASVATVPGQVELVFDGPPAGVEVVVRGPGGQVADGVEQVDGSTVTAAVPSAGAGDYVVSYEVGELVGETGFTVLRPGEAPPVTETGFGSTLVTVALVAAFAAVLVVTVRRWITSVRGPR